jgi:hypothetical protein
MRNRIKMPPPISIGIPLFPITMCRAGNDTADLMPFCMMHSILDVAASNADFGTFQSAPACHIVQIEAQEFPNERGI